MLKICGYNYSAKTKKAFRYFGYRIVPRCFFKIVDTKAVKFGDNRKIDGYGIYNQLKVIFVAAFLITG
jgi:hypothetical protein